MLSVRVADTGPGLSEADLARLYKPYKPYAQGSAGVQLRQGAGLGLALSKQIVDAKRGTLEAAPAPGSGTVFTLTVSVAAADMVK